MAIARWTAFELWIRTLVANRPVSSSPEGLYFPKQPWQSVWTNSGATTIICATLL